MLLDFFLGQERFRRAGLHVFQFGLERYAGCGKNQSDHRQDRQDNVQTPVAAACPPEAAQPETGQRFVLGERESALHEDQQGRQEKEGCIQGKNNSQPHQQPQFGQRPYIRDNQGQEGKGGCQGSREEGVAGIDGRQAERLIRRLSVTAFEMEAVVEMDRIVGAKPDDERGKGKGDDADGGIEQPRRAGRQHGPAYQDQRDQQGRQQPPVTGVKQRQDNNQRRKQPGDDVLFHDGFVSDRAQVCTGTGDLDGGSRAGFIYAGHQLPGKGDVGDRVAWFGNDNEDLAVPRKKIGRGGVQIECLGGGLQSRQNQVAQIK